MDPCSPVGPVRLDVEDEPSPGDLAILDDRVEAFTLAATRHDPPRPLAVFARAGGRVVGGVHGWSWGGCCELAALWVTSSRRGQGLARALLAAAEDAAAGRGCTQVVLFTHDVQGPSLYLHAGYELVGELDGYPSGGTAYWFRKDLRRPRGDGITGIRRHAARAVGWPGAAAVRSRGSWPSGRRTRRR